MRRAVEAQLDPSAPPRERLRRLKRVAEKIDYWQRTAEKAARCHRRRRLRRLHSMGIYVSKLRKCSPAFVAL